MVLKVNSNMFYIWYCREKRKKQEMVKSYHDNNTYTEYVGTESYNNAALPF